MNAGGFHGERERGVELSLCRHLGFALPVREYVEAGALLSYGPQWQEDAGLTARLADNVDRILRGTKRTDLPVDQPTGYELVINWTTTKALGVTVAQAVLLRAPTR